MVENERGYDFSGTFTWIQMKASFSLQITVDGEVVTDPDMTLRYLSFSVCIKHFYCYLLLNLYLHSIVSLGSDLWFKEVHCNITGT